MDSHEDYATLANGEVMNVWSVGVPTDKVSDFKEICLEDALKNYSHCLHGAHGMIYSFSDEVLWKKFKRFANVLVSKWNFHMNITNLYFLNVNLNMFVHKLFRSHV